MGNKSKLLVEELIDKRSKGVEFLKISTRMKLMMKGIDVKKLEHQPDDPDTIGKIYELATELNIPLSK